MELAKYSIGIGDRFGFEGGAQLHALQMAAAYGVHIVPVWNKSNREHTIIGTSPDDTRRAVEEAVRLRQWNAAYHLDADHIGLATVDKFLPSCDFYTIDVADYIGKAASEKSVAAFVRAMEPFKGTLTIPGMNSAIVVTQETLEEIGRKYLYAIEEAGRVYRYIGARKGANTIIPEVSLDEAALAQTPTDLFFILGAIAREGIRVQTIAPKFSGEFLKGIDYVGDKEQFAREFSDDLAVVAFAVETFNLPTNLKLSIHSGSDKFSLYPIIHTILQKSGAGLHLKTAGTTWLEEVIGLAESGGDGLIASKEIYAQALIRFDELCKPYLSVVQIDKGKLPSLDEVRSWGKHEFVAALRHDQSCSQYNVHFRQLIHVSFRIAAEMGERYTNLLRDCRTAIEENVTANIFDRHIRPLFLGSKAKLVITD